MACLMVYLWFTFSRVFVRKSRLLAIVSMPMASYPRRDCLGSVVGVVTLQRSGLDVLAWRKHPSQCNTKLRTWAGIAHVLQFAWSKMERHEILASNGFFWWYQMKFKQYKIWNISTKYEISVQNMKYQYKRAMIISGNLPKMERHEILASNGFLTTEPISLS